MVDGDLWITWISIAVIALTAGFVHSAIGFGFGIVALAIIPFVMDIKSAHVVISLSSVPMLVMAAWVYRHGIEWPSLRLAMIGAAIFLPFGLLAFEIAPHDWLVRGTGVAILAMVLLSIRNQQFSGETLASKSSCFAAGAVSGFLAGAVSVAGPPVAAFALKQGWSQDRFKAFVTQCLLVIASYKAVLLAFGGYVTFETATHTILAAPFAIVGVQLGVIASRRIPAKRFKRLVALALILISCMMIWNGSPKENEEAGNEEATTMTAAWQFGVFHERPRMRCAIRGQSL